jgi:hypothetical protein
MRQYELSPEFRAYQREAQAEAAAKLRREMKLPPHPTTECANCHRMLQAALLKIGRDT